MNKPYQNKELLQELYVEESMSTTEIADELECSQATISNYLNKYNIETRNCGVDINKEKLKKLYNISNYSRLLLQLLSITTPITHYHYSNRHLVQDKNHYHLIHE